MRQKGFAQIILIFILLAGIGVGVYLIQFTQVFKPKASTGTPETGFEADYNPFGDPWSTSLGPNNSIPVTYTTGCYRRGPKWDNRETNPDVSDAEIAYLAKSNTGIVFEECAIVQDSTNTLNRQRLINIGTKLKQVNPRAKYIGYYVLYGTQGVGWHEIYNGAEAGQNCGSVKCESFFIHKKGTSGTNKADRLQPMMFDITNPHYRTFMSQRLATALTEMNMDGFLADQITPGMPFAAPPAGTDCARNIRPVAGTICPEQDIPDNIRNNWGAAWSDFFRDIKAAIGPNRLVFANTSNQPIDFIRTIVLHDTLGNPRADGIMWEDPIGSLQSGMKDPIGNGQTRQQAISAVTSLVESSDKFLFIVVNTNAGSNCPAVPQQYLNQRDSPQSTAEQVAEARRAIAAWCFNNTSKTREAILHKYYLAGFLNIFTVKTSLIYYTPIRTSPQFDAETFFREWNLKIGASLPGSIEKANQVYVRKFQKAAVYWNNSNANYQIQGESGLFSLSGQPIAGQVVPAKTGAIFVTNDVLQEWNNPPAPPVTYALHRPVATCSGTSPVINLTWTAYPGSPEYSIFIRGKTGGETVIGSTRNTSFSVTGSHGLGLNKSYGFLIAAGTPAGSVYANGAWSDRAEVYGWTQTPVTCPLPPSPSPSSISSPSPSISTKPGDADGDGDIDIFDYNLVVTEFGKTNDPITKADVDNDNDVDIFDYNLVVGNFGR